MSPSLASPMILAPVCMLSHFNHVRFFVTPWTVACQAPLSMGFSRQEYWSGLPCPTPGDLPDPGIKPVSLASPALAGGFFTTEPPGKHHALQSLSRVQLFVTPWTAAHQAPLSINNSWSVLKLKFIINQILITTCN